MKSFSSHEIQRISVFFLKFWQFITIILLYFCTLTVFVLHNTEDVLIFSQQHICGFFLQFSQKAAKF